MDSDRHCSTDTQKLHFFFSAMVFKNQILIYIWSMFPFIPFWCSQGV